MKNSISIAYCEDEVAQARRICAMIERWAKERHREVNIILFESAEEFLFKNEVYSYDAVFLDIAMKQMNGMEAAHEIRKEDKNIPIAFLTADREFALEGYEIRAVRYLLKPITTEKLWELLDRLLEDIKEKTKDTACIMVEAKGMLHRVEEEKICYMDVLGHYTQIHLSDASVIRVKESLGRILEKLHKKGQFVKCHRSYVVNLIYIEKISRTECMLTDGEILPVSRNSYQELNASFIQHYLHGTG
ncbi:MAG: LytTR family DNA-binding domain-containing protein [Blautia sp.]|nr:LytTR family DNA-binding domain-containing protein [Blautia sp.]